MGFFFTIFLCKIQDQIAFLAFYHILHLFPLDNWPKCLSFFPIATLLRPFIATEGAGFPPSSINISKQQIVKNIVT